MADTAIKPKVDEQARDAFSKRLFNASVATLDIASVYLGDRLGLYRGLADGGPATAAELARRAGADARYVREWLEHQAASAILTVDDPSNDPEARRYALPPEHAEVLLDASSMAFTMPVVRQILGSAVMAPAVAGVFRRGGGIGWSDYGPDVVEAQVDLNRPHFEALMTEWIAAMPDVHERLQRPGARIADIGCGGAWSAIALARAYPGALVEGFDLDEGSIAIANENIRAAGLGDRVKAHVRDVADPSLAGKYDLVAAFECIHDLSRPVDALRVMRGMVNDGGGVLIMDEAVGEQFAAPASDVDRFYYGISVLLCLPNGLAEQPSAGTGTVMRPATLERYAGEAGFARTEVLPIDHPLWRFYRLHP